MLDRQVGSASCANGNENQNVVLRLSATRLVTTATTVNAVVIVDLDIKGSCRWCSETCFLANTGKEIVHGLAN